MPNAHIGLLCGSQPEFSAGCRGAQAVPRRGCGDASWARCSMARPSTPNLPSRSALASAISSYTSSASRAISDIAPPERLLAWVIAAAGGLSALLANDIVCFAMAPMLLEAGARRCRSSRWRAPPTSDGCKGAGMGDKGGKKDKEKNKQQQVKKQKQEEQKKQDKARPRTP